MMRTANQQPDVFPQIWAALTTDHLMSLLAPLRPRPHGRHLTFACPACGKLEAYIYEPKDGKGPRLHCNRKNNCGHDETLWEYVKRLHGGDGREALAILAAATGVRLESHSPFSLKKARLAQTRARFALAPAPEPPPVTGDMDAKMADYQARLPGSPAEAYLAERGVAPGAAASMGFGYCPSWPDYRSSWPSEGRARVAYPLTDRLGRVVAIEGRALSDIRPKSLCDGLKGAGVFAPGRFHQDDLHLCEGPFDAVSLVGLGQNAVALCGAAIPAWLLHSCSFRHVQAAFDADAGGDRATEMATEALAKRGSVVRRLRPPRMGADWGDYLLESLPDRFDALWEAQGVSTSVRTLRTAFSRLMRQIEYLQHHQRGSINDWETRIARVASGLEDFNARCDLPGGYADPDDPFADEALLVLRHHFSFLEP